MRCVEYTMRLLTLCAAWTFALAQDITTDDDFDPQDFEEAQNYLAKYNYFHGPKPTYLRRPADMEEAIREMQDFNGIPVTGKLDRFTMNKMRARRCGVADFVGVRTNARLVKRYSLAGEKWSHKSISYRIVNYTPDLPRDEVRFIIQKAFQTWADHTPLRFTEVRGGADIDILFAREGHGDGFEFDGQGGTLAHAFFPGSGIGGDAHFDDDEIFTSNTQRGTNLFVVMAHELGHSLGLAHSSNEDALMAPYYQGYRPNFRLPRDDIMGIQELYGRAPYRPQYPNRPNRPNYPNTPNRPPWQPPERPEQPEGPEQPPHRPEQPPHRPGQPPYHPGACGASFQAAMTFDGRVYLFQGKNYWMLEENGRMANGYPRLIARDWNNAPSNIDAAFVMSSTENVIFFKGNTWYEYRGRALFRRGTLRELGLPDNVRRIDAAVIWDGNSKPYFFAGNDYYRFNERMGFVDQGYPKPISTNWLYIPGNVNAAFGSQGYTYFIKGQSYYQFDNNAVRAVAGPKDFGADFLGCRARRYFQLAGDASQPQAKVFTLILSLICATNYFL